MAKRFSTHQFCAAWAKHGPESKTWNEFADKMRKESGNPHYPDSEIKRRLSQYKSQLRGKVKAPYYPAERTHSAVAYFNRHPQTGTKN